LNFHNFREENKKKVAKKFCDTKESRKFALCLPTVASFHEEAG
jgi:hypothetical protein